MKKSIFITGIAGSGKSTVGRELEGMGYRVYDMEDNKYGLFSMAKNDTGTKKVFDIPKLRELLNNQTEDIAFYCGVANDNENVVFLFDLSVLLQVTSETLERRLLEREGTDAFAGIEEMRQKVLGWKNEFEERMIQAGMQVVDAGQEINDVATAIIKLAKIDR